MSTTSIDINLGSVEAYDNLPIGSYLGQIDKITFREAKEAGKFPQLMATYVVIDEQALGRKSSEFISLSPKAAFRLKRWFMKFGLGELPKLEVDDTTNELLEPDLIGYQVIFTVTQDRGDATRFRTELFSVEDDLEDARPAPVVAAPVAVAADPVEDKAAIAAAKKAAKIAAAQAALEAASADDEGTEEEEVVAPVAAPVAAPAPTRGAHPGRPANAQPTRRTLR